jgi:hypothetical protein
MTSATIDLIPAFAVFVNDLATVTLKDRIACLKVGGKTIATVMMPEGTSIYPFPVPSLLGEEAPVEQKA